MGRVATCGKFAHRYSAPHALGVDRKAWLQKCRICGDSIILTYDEKNGQITQKTYEVPNKHVIVS